MSAATRLNSALQPRQFGLAQIFQTSKRRTDHVVVSQHPAECVWTEPEAPRGFGAKPFQPMLIRDDSGDQRDRWRPGNLFFASPSGTLAKRQRNIFFEKSPWWRASAGSEMSIDNFGRGGRAQIAAGLRQVDQRCPLPRRNRAHPLRERRKVAIDQAVDGRGRHVGIRIAAVRLDLLATRADRHPFARLAIRDPPHWVGTTRPRNREKRAFHSRA